jgi:D-alanine-D-alanine ligase
LKIRVGVLVGGASSEREISLASGKMVAEHLPKDRYEVVILDTLALMAHNPRIPDGLRREAAHLLGGGGATRATHPSELPKAFQHEIEEAASRAVPATRALVPGAGAPPIDVAFLALHGPYGEDGTVQGFLDLLGIPYVGSGVLASAVAMDKEVAKILMGAAGIPTPRGTVLARGEFDADERGAAERAGAFVPAVVKPVRQGSSIGMSLAPTPADLPSSLRKAFAFDSRVLVEERLEGTEITVGILGNRDLQALPVVEIVTKKSFFDYQAKYDPALSEEICPARIGREETERCQALGLRAHAALRCRGVSRVDMILTRGGPVVLEVNTIPGMTVNSLLPKAARVAGIPFPELLDRLIRLALEGPED